MRTATTYGLDAYDERLIGHESPYLAPERDEAAAQRGGHELRKPAVHPGRRDAGHVRATGQRAAATAGHEIRQPLGRSDLTVSDLLIGLPFELLLEPQPGQRAVFGTQMLEIRQAHLGHDTRVGEDRVASDGDMPLTTDSPPPVMAGTINPPGHMQNE